MLHHMYTLKSTLIPGYIYCAPIYVRTDPSEDKNFISKLPMSLFGDPMEGIWTRSLFSKVSYIIILLLYVMKHTHTYIFFRYAHRALGGKQTL